MAEEWWKNKWVDGGEMMGGWWRNEWVEGIRMNWWRNEWMDG